MSVPFSYSGHHHLSFSHVFNVGSEKKSVLVDPGRPQPQVAVQEVAGQSCKAMNIEASCPGYVLASWPLRVGWAQVIQPELSQRRLRRLARKAPRSGEKALQV